MASTNEGVSVGGRAVLVSHWRGAPDYIIELHVPNLLRRGARRQGCNIVVAFCGCGSINTWIVCVHVAIIWRCASQEN